jgi:hypothetical protein
MALLSRPLTEAEARKMIADWRQDWPKIPTFYDMLVEAINNPTPHVVRYYATDWLTEYTPPKEFYWGVRTSTPSDCTWIVPGTLERKI